MLTFSKNNIAYVAGLTFGNAKRLDNRLQLFIRLVKTNSPLFLEFYQLTLFLDGQCNNVRQCMTKCLGGIAAEAVT